MATEEVTTASSWITGVETEVAYCGGKGTSPKGLIDGEGTSLEKYAKRDSMGQNDGLKSDKVRP